MTSKNHAKFANISKAVTENCTKNDAVKIVNIPGRILFNLHYTILEHREKVLTTNPQVVTV